MALASLNARTGGRDHAVIDSRDPLYYRPRLWQFTSRDGTVVAGRLFTLPQLGIKAIYLNYRTTTRADRYGNQFRYQARVISNNPRTGKYAYDVFFTTGAAAACPGSSLGARLPAGLALIAAGLLLAVQPATGRRRHTTRAGDARPAPGPPPADLILKS